MDLKNKKIVKTYLYVKKSQLFEKNTISPIAMQDSTQNWKLTLKMCFWGSSATSILNFIFFFEKLTLFYIKHHFQIGIRTGSQWFITMDGGICCKSVEIKKLFNFSYFTSVSFWHKSILPHL